MTKFYKILNEKECHNDLQYKTGLNVDPNEFQKEGSCVEGGIYFAPVTSILAFCEYGPNIREVTLPNDSQWIKDPGEGDEKYRADKVVFGPRMDLWKVETFQRLVSEGADIHAGDDQALKWAARNGYLEVVEFLVENGADIHAWDDFALEQAACNGHLEVVEFLVSIGADIHTCEDLALRKAAYNGHLEVVKFLVENGADIHAWGNRALRFADEKGHSEVVEYLKSQGC